MVNNEVEGYDLSTTGTLVELERTSSDVAYGVTIQATSSADFEIEVDGGTVTGITINTFSSATFVDVTFEGPQIVDIRVKNTTTTVAGETADAMIGTGE
jgi:hypothetical protein